MESEVHMKVISLLSTLLVFQTVHALERMMLDSVVIVQPKEPYRYTYESECDWLSGSGLKNEEENSIFTENRNKN